MSSCQNMPAMPKEKQTAVSLNNSNIGELNLQELTVSVSSKIGDHVMRPVLNNNTVFRKVNSNQYENCNHTPKVISNEGAQQQDNQRNHKTLTTYDINNEHQKKTTVIKKPNATTTTMTAILPVDARLQLEPSCQLTTDQVSHLQDSKCVTLPKTSTASTTTLKSSEASHPKKSPRDYIFGKYIGEGSFSTVYLAVDVNNRREYAIKVCEKRQILREHKQEYIKREREVMHMLSNVPGFVDLSCTFQDARSLYFVMTYARNGDLLPYINKVGSFDVDCTRHYAAELVLACEQMHRRNIVHRDLKPENILLDEDMHTLIADFGSARIMTSEERITINQYLRGNNNSSNKTNLSHRGTNGNVTPPLGSSVCSKYSMSSPSSSSSSSDSSSLSTSIIKPTSDGKNACEVPVTTSRTDAGDTNSSANDTGSSGDDVDSRSSFTSLSGYDRKRKGSFVGTAQYVSPEVLQNGPITPAADLWALGCIVYQMMAGLPPFRGSNDYMIFKEIIACNPEFPEGFDKEAEDLVKKLLRLQPCERLGAQDMNGCYVSIRSHPFFKNINIETIRQQVPPPICPYLPDLIKGYEFSVSENLEPGLDKKQLTRLLGLELGYIEDPSSQASHSCFNTTQTKALQNCTNNQLSTSNGTNSNFCQNHLSSSGRQRTTNHLLSTSASSSNSLASLPSTSSLSLTAIKNLYELTGIEKQKRLELQKCDKWHVFADDEVILKKGFVNKRKGLFARRRMLLLTTGPRLIYIDPFQMVKKGEIPWSPELRVEAKNFKIFFIHTPNRTYYLDDPEGYSLEWVAAIEKMHLFTYKRNDLDTIVSNISTTAATLTITNPRTNNGTTRSIGEVGGLFRSKLHSNRHKNTSNSKQFASGNGENELVTKASSMNSPSTELQKTAASTSPLTASFSNVIKTSSN